MLYSINMNVSNTKAILFINFKSSVELNAKAFPRRISQLYELQLKCHVEQFINTMLTKTHLYIYRPTVQKERISCVLTHFSGVGLCLIIAGVWPFCPYSLYLHGICLAIGLFLENGSYKPKTESVRVFHSLFSAVEGCRCNMRDDQELHLGHFEAGGSDCQV